jgi:transcription termination factor Rho
LRIDFLSGISLFSLHKVDNPTLCRLQLCERVNASAHGRPCTTVFAHRILFGGLSSNQLMTKESGNKVEGVLEVLPEGFGFLRRLENCYLPHPADIYVPRGLIRGQQLRSGSEVTGPVISGKDSGKKKQLSDVESVDGLAPSAAQKRAGFQKLISIDPHERLRVDVTNDISMRVIDLLTPIGKGQRGLIVAPPRTGKTMLLQKLAQSISEAHPEIHLMVVLINERPEEVTEMRRSIRGEVIYSSSDEMSRKHVNVAEIVLERARRLVESGRDVVILMDSLTRMARAYNIEHRGSGRTMSGGLGAGSLAKPREFFGAARKVEDGGSLTILATALIDTGSRMDDVIFEEFKGTGNMELVLNRDLADRRIWPSVDITASGTRKEEKLRDPENQRRINLLRRALSDLSPERAMQALLRKLGETPDNQTFLRMIEAGF